MWRANATYRVKRTPVRESAESRSSGESEDKSQPTEPKLEQEMEHDGHKRSDRCIRQPRGSGRRLDETSEVRFRGETLVSSGEGLSYRRTSRWLLQRRRSAEAAEARNILSTLKPTHVTDHLLEAATQTVTRRSLREVRSHRLQIPPHASSGGNIPRNSGILVSVTSSCLCAAQGDEV
jgi:hypothetical protein